MASKRKQEEKLTRQLRELVALPGNKHCFDCHQRGPTYVNMTIGSFVCTSCSGILRGLNPPHRAKSISMANFTSEEVEMVRQRGNDYCRKVWLGLYDGDNRFDGNRDEHQIKEFLPLKYEKKRWYVSPNEIARQQSILDSQKTGGSNNSAGGTSPTAPSSGYASNEGSNSLIDTAISPSAQTTHVSTPQTQNNQQVNEIKSASSQLMNAFGGDPFGSPVRPPPQSLARPPPAVAAPLSQSSGGFADFANFDAFSSPAPVAAPAPLIAPMAHVASVSLVQPTAITNGSVMHKSATMPVGGAHNLGPPSAGVNYSALAELDSLFTTSTTISPKQPTPLNNSWNAGSPPAFAGQSGLGIAPMNVGVPKSSTVNAFPSNEASFGASSNPFMTPTPVAPSQAMPANPFGGVAAANPFANGWAQQVLPPQPLGMPWQDTTAHSSQVNPFAGPPAQQTMTGNGGPAGNWNPFL